MVGSAGLLWEVADVISASRSNQKQRFVGTGAQIAALFPTYAGQVAYCTTSGSGYQADQKYERNAANSAWGQVKDSIKQAYPHSSTIGDYSFASQVSANVTPDFDYTFGDATGWTLETTYTITNSKLRHVADSSTIKKAYSAALGTALSNSVWQINFDVSSMGSSYNTTHMVLSLGDGTSQATPTATMDAVFVLWVRNAPTSSLIYLGYKDGAAGITQSAGSVEIGAYGNLYFVWKRTSTTTQTLDIYSDAARTSLIGSISQTIPATLINLKQLVHSDISSTTNATIDLDNITSDPNSFLYSMDGVTGSYGKSASIATPYAKYQLSNSADKDVGEVALMIPTGGINTLTTMRIYASADDATYTLMRTFLVSALTGGAYAYIRLNRADQAIKWIKVDSPDTGVLAIAEIKFLMPSAEQFDRQHQHLYVSPTDTAIPLAGE